MLLVLVKAEMMQMEELLLAWRSWESAVAGVGHMPAVAVVVAAGIASSLAVDHTAVAVRTAGIDHLADHSHTVGIGSHTPAGRHTVVDSLHRTAVGHSHIAGIAAGQAGMCWRPVGSSVHLV